MNPLFREHPLLRTSRVYELKRVHCRSASEPYQTSKMEHFANIANGFEVLTIFAKRSILDV